TYAMAKASEKSSKQNKPVKATSFEGSWRDFIERAFKKIDSRAIILADRRETLRFGVDPVLGQASRAIAQSPDALPDWIGALAVHESPSDVLPPSAATRAHVAAVSPLAEAHGLGRWRRGALIHSLLERLPETQPDHWPDLADRLLAREPGLTGEQRAEIASAVLGVLAGPDFAPLFGPGSRAEVPLVGEVAGQAVFGRIDRLLVTPGEVLVVDYKTNRPPPKTAEAVDPDYLRQMALYAALLHQIHPKRPVRAALLWTDGPTLMPLPEALLDPALS
ncbi:MAG: PD-(D/E)XK nuclease family protein, partial [Caulobacteraceae bacterium]